MIKLKDPHTASTEKQLRLLEIDKEMERNDLATIRAVRAKSSTGGGTAEDQARIDTLEAQAVALRQERAAIEAELKAMDEAK